MPAKPNILPKLCPICKSDHGSIRIGIIAGHRGSKITGLENGKIQNSIVDYGGQATILIRIKHYSKEGYQDAKQIIDSGIPFDEITTIYSKKKKEKKQIINIMKYKTVKQQKWCSFRIKKDFAFNFEPKTFGVYQKLKKTNKRKSIDWKPSDNFLHAIKKHGWNDLPKYSSKYKKR